MITVTLKDGSKREYESGTTILAIAKSISQGLGKAAVAAHVNGKTADLTMPVESDIDLDILTFDTEYNEKEKSDAFPGKQVFWHTSAHIMAQAIKRLYPNAKLTIGPPIDEGFYYDFDFETPFSVEDLSAIEKEMQKIVKENLPLRKFVLPRDEAIKFVTDRGEPYKIELINSLPDDEEISFYEQGEFVDLCIGKHLPSTGLVKSFKLMSVAGAYWRGDSNNKMLTRIYGISFPKKATLDEYLTQIEEAKKRDHNKVGRELKYFTSVDVIGQGLPLFMPKGAKVLQLLQRFVEDEEEARGYQITKTPLMAKKDLYKMSGHWQKYRDGMFYVSNAVEELETSKNDQDPDIIVREHDIMALRPMTCPFQFNVYNAEQHSYRDLPIRLAETSTLFRNESSGEMHGMLRMRQFTISEGHIICREDQVKEEFYAAFDLARFMMKTIGIENDVTYTLSTWDPTNTKKFFDAPDVWANSQKLLREIMEETKLIYTEDVGGAAFYGPKLDIDYKNVHGKKDTIITIQLDFLLPNVYDMTYVDKDGNKQRPVIIHRTSIGCYERTLAYMIERYAGAMPTWLAPTQVAVLPLSDKYQQYAENIANQLKKEGIRTKLDDRSEKVGYKIREARLERTPYILVAGEEEEKANSISVRSRELGEEGMMPIDVLVTKVLKDIQTKSLGATKNN